MEMGIVVGVWRRRGPLDGVAVVLYRLWIRLVSVRLQNTGDVLYAGVGDELHAGVLFAGKF